LAELGVRFERWTAAHTLAEDASPADILAAYASDVERLKRERGYLSADVVRLKRDAHDTKWVERAQAARAKFLDEHTHAEDEVRFFVEGSGLFALHIGDTVTLMVCERGDLLSVPAGTRHWFDMGSEPSFCAIRVFGNELGWLAEFTGDKIGGQFPSYDDVRQHYSA
jgi:1,2-dihydroxy-3-keto-5-methylthiopentene dioxygenase